MNAALGLESDIIKVEHVFMFGFNDKWDKPMRRVAEACVRIGFVWAESFRIIAIGLSAGFVLMGTARLIEAVKSKSPGSSNDTRRTSGDSKSSKYKSKVKTSSSKSKSDGKDEAPQDDTEPETTPTLPPN